jgi:hypothetical protein
VGKAGRLLEKVAAAGRAAVEEASKKPAGKAGEPPAETPGDRTKVEETLPPQ